MRSVILIVYVVMGSWLIIAAIGRVVLQLLSDQPVDTLPFITGGLGLFALVLVLPVLVRRRREQGRRIEQGGRIEQG